jgi:hypothetical protein
MRLLYQELRVPLPAMICGLSNLKIFSLQQFNAEERDSLEPYFEHLTNQLKRF